MSNREALPRGLFEVLTFAPVACSDKPRERLIPRESWQPLRYLSGRTREPRRSTSNRGLEVLR